VNVTPETTLKELGGRVVGRRLSLFIVYVWARDGILDYRLFFPIIRNSKCEKFPHIIGKGTH
jgi:hypothetical protein